MAEPRDHFIRRQREASVDHDLLIALNVKLDNLTQEMADLKKETIGRVSALEAAAVRKSDLGEGVLPTLKDHETRLRRLETWGTLAIGGLFVVQVLIQFFHFGLK